MAEPVAEHRQSLRLTFSCELTQVRGVARQAHEFLAQQGCSEDDMVDCELALVEACNNAIEYARDAARGLSVEVELRCESSFIEMRVKDHTAGFDWAHSQVLPDPDSERGRGLFLIQSVMTHAEYIRGETGNVMLMRRQRSG